MSMSFLKEIFSIFHNKPEASNDQLGVYPEKVDVRALPERRYLRASRFLVIFTLVSILFNFAMCFIYIRNINLVDRIIAYPGALNTYMYSLDYYSKELKPVEGIRRSLSGLDLVVQNLIADYIKERYEVVSSMEEMSRRWRVGGKLSSYMSQKKFEEFLNEARGRLSMLNRGITQKVFVYYVKPLSNDGFYEAVFDIFPVRENVFGAEDCMCFEADEKCLACLRKTTLGSRRYKAYLRVSVDLTAAPDQQIVQSNNPYAFQVIDYYLMEYRNAPQKGKKSSDKKEEIPYTPWGDIDNRLE